MPLFMETQRIDGGVAVAAPDADAADRVHREAHGLSLTAATRSSRAFDEAIRAAHRSYDR